MDEMEGPLQINGKISMIPITLCILLKCQDSHKHETMMKVFLKNDKPVGFRMQLTNISRTDTVFTKNLMVLCKFNFCFLALHEFMFLSGPSLLEHGQSRNQLQGHDQ